MRGRQELPARHLLRANLRTTGITSALITHWPLATRAQLPSALLGVWGQVFAAHAFAPAYILQPSTDSNRC